MYGLVAFEAHHGKKSLLDTKSIWAETTEIYFGLERCEFMLWLRHFLAESTTGSAAWVSYFNLSPSLLFCKTGSQLSRRLRREDGVGLQFWAGALAQPLTTTPAIPLSLLGSQIFPEKSCGCEDLGLPRKCAISKALSKVTGF